MVVRMRRALVAVLVMLMLLSIGGISAAADQDFGLSPKQRFFLAQYRFTRALQQEIASERAVPLALSKERSENPSSSRIALTADMEISDGSMTENDRRILRESQLVFLDKLDPKAGKSSIRAAYSFGGKELFSAEAYRSQDLLSLYLPVLYPKPIFVENKDLRPTFEKVDLPVELAQLLTRPDLSVLFQTDSDQLRDVVTAYGKLIIDAIQDEDITVEKDVPVESPEGMVQAERLTLTLTQQQLEEILGRIAQRFKDDEQALDLVAGKVALHYQLQAEWGIPGNNEESLKLRDPGYVKSGLKEAAAAIAEEPVVPMPGGIQISLLLHQGQTVRETISFTVGAEEESSVQFSLMLEGWQTKDRSTHRNVRLVVAPRAEQSDLTVAFRSKTTPVSNRESKKSTSISFAVNDQGKEMVNARFDLQGSLLKESEVGKDLYTGDFTLTFGENVGGKIYGKVSSLSSNTLTSRYERRDVVELTLDEDDPSSPDGTIRITVDQTVNTNVPLEFPVVNEETGFNLTTASPEEIETLKTEMLQAFNRFLEETVHLFE